MSQHPIEPTKHPWTWPGFESSCVFRHHNKVSRKDSLSPFLKWGNQRGSEKGSNPPRVTQLGRGRTQVFGRIRASLTHSPPGAEVLLALALPQGREAVSKPGRRVCLGCLEARRGSCWINPPVGASQDAACSFTAPPPRPSRLSLLTLRPHPARSFPFQAPSVHSSTLAPLPNPRGPVTSGTETQCPRDRLPHLSCSHDLI